MIDKELIEDEIRDEVQDTMQVGSQNSSQDSNPDSNPNGENVCRICRENEEPLFCPCKCNSSVHQECLIDWVKSKHGNHNDDLINYDDQECEICKSKIHFIRMYDKHNGMGTVELIKTSFKSIRKYGAPTFEWFCVALAIIVGVLIVFVIRRWVLTGDLPRIGYLKDYFIDQKSLFMTNDLQILFEFFVLFFLLKDYVLKSGFSKRIINFHLHKNEDEPMLEIWGHRDETAFNIQVFLGVLVSTPLLFLVIEYIPIYVFGLLNFKLNDNTSFIFAHIIISFIISNFPVKWFPKKNELLFTRLFFFKYVFKLMFLSLVVMLSPFLIVKPCIDYFFAEKLLRSNNYNFDICDITMTSLLMNPFYSFLNVVKKSLKYANGNFYRSGVFSFAQELILEEKKVVDMLFLRGTLYNLVEKIKVYVYLTGTCMWLFGVGFVALVNQNPTFLPMTLGMATLPDGSAGRLQVFFVQNIHKFVDLCCPLLKNFSKHYYRPIALKIARSLRLSEYLFNEHKISERGSIMYRNAYYEYLRSKQAQLSNNSLFSNPQSRTSAKELFSSNGNVHAYFVPDGQYMRVPNDLPRDQTREYFIPVTRKDELIREEKKKAQNEYSPFRDQLLVQYDVLYTPPQFSFRLFLYHFIFGTVHWITFLYALLSSYKISSVCFNFLRNIDLVSSILSTRKNEFSFLGVFLGFMIQLQIANAIFEKNLSGSTSMIKGALNTFKISIFGYGTFFPAILISFMCAGLISYATTTLYTIAFETLFMHGGIEGDLTRSFLIHPFYPFSNHMFIFVIPCGVWNMCICGHLVFKIFIEDLNFSQCLQLVWSNYYGFFLRLYCRYFAGGLLLQALIVLVNDYKFHHLNLEAIRKCMASNLFAYDHSVSHYLYVLLVPINFFPVVLYDVFTYAKTKLKAHELEVIDKMNEDKIMLVNKKNN